jgi:hypothetical protein
VELNAPAMNRAFLFETVSAVRSSLWLFGKDQIAKSRSLPGFGRMSEAG